ncbi:guanine nucleotide exchange factor MSS4 homolog [Rhizophagus clarus]|uniref:Guanine nucleotide exchange factor MSS4 homolog n=1 Tax=Rhizophagus clarus TaxID=94130 RepID=A0A8H3KUK2_9GLOM|nr:guanine nucleotide exchange factor MSS4 homolog [Rhizophagus clarus]
MEDLLTDKSYDISYDEWSETSDQQPIGTPYSGFTDPQNELVDSEKYNIYHIFCTKNCHTLILRANLGKWVERSKEKLKIPGENKKVTKESDSENSGNSEKSENFEKSADSQNSGNSVNSENFEKSEDSQKSENSVNSENFEKSGDSQNSKNSQNTQNSETSSSDDNQGFWVLNDVVAFENISVTNTIVTGVRYLCCPRCENDVLPIGYHDTSMKKDEYLIAVDRVNYSDNDYSDQIHCNKNKIQIFQVYFFEKDLRSTAIKEELCVKRSERYYYNALTSTINNLTVILESKDIITNNDIGAGHVKNRRVEFLLIIEGTVYNEK